MVVNQAQVDQILTAASEDDPEVKLQSLEREVDLIKTSIKRLLIDIRERMNDIDNPFTLTGAGPVGQDNSQNIKEEANDAHESALDARESALKARESTLESSSEKAKEKKGRRKRDDEDEDEDEEDDFEEERPTRSRRKEKKDEFSAADERLLAALRSQLAQESATAPPVQLPTMPAVPPIPDSSSLPEKLRLQKAYRLFKWTNRSVKKYGHDRLESMLQSYRSMGYISQESCAEVIEIARLMPAVLGEVHEIDPGEYVAELYVLNRILSPNDITLDRDMIEVLMEQRQGLASDEPGAKDRIKGDEWVNLLDRI
jgi:Tfp pilus assembly protein PilX